MNVLWTETAGAHLDAIHAYISHDSPEYARIAVDRITRRSVQIAEHPLAGRRVPEFDCDQVREVIEGSYRIMYRVGPDSIEVLAVIHGAMDAFRET
jgi:plasmid stabilization system protein ParE